jgi:Spy/CpxP family protein refolding chaperone
MSPVTIRRTRATGVALLVATFAAGMLAGAASGRLLSAGEPRTSVGEPTRGGDRSGGPRLIIHEVDLTEEQKTRVEEILARRRAITDSLWRTDGRRIRASVDSTREEIRAMLTPGQRAEYDRLREEHALRRRERPRGRGRSD